MLAGDDTLFGDGIGTVTVGSFVEADYADIVFGDHGVVEQDVPRGRVFASASAALAQYEAFFGPTTGVLPASASDKLLTTGYVQVIRSVVPSNGGDDRIEGNTGRDVLIGGNGSDRIDGGAGADLIFGDHGLLSYLGPDYFGITETGLAGLGTLDEVRSIFTVAVAGKGDHITDDAGDDLIFGGQGNDLIDAGAGQNIVFGDHGRILGVDGGVNTPVGDPDASKTDDNYQVQVLGRVESIDWGTVNGVLNEFGNGNDTITTGIGRDIILGGGGDDRIDSYASSGGTALADGNNIVFGDHGFVDYLVQELAAVVAANPPRTNDIDVISSIVLATAMGGHDRIATGDRNDIVIGGTGNDVIDTGDGVNIAMGDNAKLHSAPFDTPSRVFLGVDMMPFSVHEFVLCEIETIGFDDADSGSDTITGSALNDILFGGGGSDVIYAGGGDDLVFGDQGRVECKNGVPIIPEISLRPICWDLFPDSGFLLFQATNIGSNEGAGDDLIFGEDGSDLIMGQQGNDVLYGGNGDDIVIGGSNVAGALDGDDRIDGGAGHDAIAGDNAAICYRPDALDVRMRALQGTLIYGTGVDDDGQALVVQLQDDTHHHGVPVPIYADPRYAARSIVSGVLDKNSGHAQYHITLLDHSDDIQTNHPELFGNDYIAGGGGEDEIFGQLGHDVIQGDGTIGVGKDLPFRLSYDDNLAAAQLSVRKADGSTVDITDFTLFNGNRGAVPTALEDFLFTMNPQLALNVLPSFEGWDDGDDYIEGNGGNDVVFGNLGQDDIIGGSSNLFGLHHAEQRPEGSDLLFGGAGIDITRNDIGDATTGRSAGLPTAAADDLIRTKAGGHAHDADTLVGDNGNILRLVGINGTQRSNGDFIASQANPGTLFGVSSTGGFLNFNYDLYGPAVDSGVGSKGGGYGSDGVDRSYDRIIVRAVELLDYTEGGIDTSDAALSDRGAGDEIHGEAGDDTAYGMVGNDVLYGDGQDDDLIGGTGHDWISGGTGNDGVIGDDGRIMSSRNATTYGEALHGVLALQPDNGDTRTFNGNMMNEAIATPGNIQQAVVNVGGEMKKAVNLTPFSFDPQFNGNADEFTTNAKKTVDTLGRSGASNADDIIFGGLGDDWLHGGSGDDAIGGGEALPRSYTQVYADSNGDGVDELVGTTRSDFDHPYNPADALRFNPLDPDGWHFDRTRRAGEFALYDEYDPRRKILLNADGTAAKDGQEGLAVEWFLNFLPNEGTYVPGGTLNTNGQQATSYGQAWNDGNDRIFGDLGNDWIVGGTGRDNLYGGFGNDLLNADDFLETNGDERRPSSKDTVDSLNDNESPDTQPSYEDRAFGGGGRDILIGNTGGDRLIDWVGEFNSYLVPFAPFGMATVSRTLQPQLAEFLYTLSASDGADPTRAKDSGSAAARNGEPEGELGVVRQQDFAWQSQTGAPTDPQAGNIPGGKRDVLRTANFNDGQMQALAPDSGSWEVSSGALQVAAKSNKDDAVAVYQVGDALPSYFELQAAVKAIKPTGGWNANSYIVFDYQSATNFKYAGINVSTNKLEIGQRTAAGWQTLSQASVQGGVKDNTWYNLLLSVNGLTVTLVVNNSISFGHSFQPTVVDGWSYGLNWGLVGFGSNRARGALDNLTVQVLPPAVTVSVSDEFTGGAGTMVTAVPGSSLGSWTAQGNRLAASSAPGGGLAVQLLNLSGVAQLSALSVLEMNTVFSTQGRSGMVFDRYSDTDFKFVAVDVNTREVIVGHRTASGWSVDASVVNSALLPGVDLKLGVSIKGASVSVTLNDQAALGHIFNGVGVDGRFGLFTQGAEASFDAVTVRTNDPAVPAPLRAGTAAGASVNLAGADPGLSVPAADGLSLDAAAPLFDEAGRRWALVEDALHLRALQRVQLAVADLPAGELARFHGDTITVDATADGLGWFIDDTPADDAEYLGTGGVLQARSGSAAAGRIDLLSVLAHEMGHAMGLGHSDDGVMAASLMPGLRSTPERWGDSAHGLPATALPALLARGPAPAAMPQVQIDWGVYSARAAAADAAVDRLTKPAAALAAPGKPAPAPSSWLQRFVNAMGASASQARPNEALTLQVHAEVSHQVSPETTTLR